MDSKKKAELEKRNKHIIDAVLAKIEKTCPGCVDLIGIGGSFFSGDIHEHSDLDLLIIINDERAYEISSCFILDGVGFDIYCSTWDRLEDMASFKDPYSGKLIDLEIVFTLNKEAEERYYRLQSTLLETLNSPLSDIDIEKAKEYLGKAESEYIELMIHEDMAPCRYASALFLHNIEFSIYMLNKRIVKYGIKRIPQEIKTMPILPENFLPLHKAIVCAESLSELKTACTSLVKSMRQCFENIDSKPKERKEISPMDLTGTYEEIYSNWKSKMHNSIAIKNPYLSFQTMASCQHFYNMMSGTYKINPIDIMKGYIPSDLAATAKHFDEGMEEYLKLYTSLNVPVKNYQTIEEFKKAYLG